MGVELDAATAQERWIDIRPHPRGEYWFPFRSKASNDWVEAFRELGGLEGMPHGPEHFIATPTGVFFECQIRELDTFLHSLKELMVGANEKELLVTRAWYKSDEKRRARFREVVRKHFPGE